ncbi:hypothetical protein GLYMA_02G023600v4 [Glycine max]|uniref:TIR domain-containing protein n=2 Tax=Glycine subgen. Soja TaxID=1462606 RepID=A0A0R0KQA9_SOYBN|nr:hypothetical protein GLYMA_02G023600v4 [Glycine max]RZC23061.1 TMV resistance protein N [Glycine soja]
MKCSLALALKVRTHATLSQAISVLPYYNLERGDEISTVLLRAIQESKLSVVVFSKNYATSKWCLNELVKILECKKMNRQIIVPVFNDRDPSTVRNQSGTYAVAFAKHEQQLRGDIRRHEQLSNLQAQHLMMGSGFNTQLWRDLQATNQRLEQLRMGKSVRLEHIFYLHF